MAQGEIIKNLVKPPFANYDIVVYFGCGLFSLPFIRHYYIDPFGFRFPKFNFDLEIPFAGVVISTLALLFSVYIVGHIIAYVGSQFVEKAMDTFLGKTSTMVLLSSKTTDVTRNVTIRGHLAARLTDALKPQNRVASIGRAIFHLPVAVFYGIAIWLGIFGFYGSRVPQSVIDGARAKMTKIGLEGVSIDVGNPWFKALEGYVINNFPIATARMYNYLVISGLFRSITLIFLTALWFEAYYLIHHAITGHQHIGLFMSDSGGVLTQVWGYGVLAAIYLFALFSYLKFQRRYVEEALFAFVLAKED